MLKNTKKHRGKTFNYLICRTLKTKNNNDWGSFYSFLLIEIFL